MTSEGGANVNPGTGNDQELSFTTLGAGPEAGQQYVVTQDVRGYQLDLSYSISFLNLQLMFPFFSLGPST